MKSLPKGAMLWLVPVLILALGTWGSWGLSQAFRQDAQRAWQAQAEQTAQGLSGTLLAWLEESYAPLSGLAVLAENSDPLTEVAYLNGLDDMESRATAFFLDSAAYLRLNPDQGLQLVITTDMTGPLALGSAAEDLESVKLAAAAAFEQPGRILLGPPFTLAAGSTVSTVVLGINEPNGQPAVVLGLVNYDALIEGLFEQLVPAGLTLQMSGKFLGDSKVPVYTTRGKASLHSVTTRTISAGADLSITWDVGPQFEGGVPDKLARFALYAGTAVSVIMALFIGMLLRRNQVISCRIKEATRELALSKDAADAANQAKSAFLANMSHELRTPMNAILGYSEMLMEEAEDVGQDDFIPDLKKINQAGNHLLTLINDVLDLSKIESGKMEAFTEVFDVGAFIDQITGTAQPLMVKNTNHFRIERDDNLGKACQDITKLRQSLLNLLSNAAKFTHEGTITLQAERQSQADGDWLTFAVSDTGIGIAADKLGHVFEEFSQADESTTRDFGGTGLGLAISRRFCQMLGGKLSVSSELGAGSTFTIRLPATLPGAEVPQEDSTQPASSVAQTSAEGPQAKHGNTLLVIDDDAEACEIIRRFLEKDGFDVVTAVSGEEGLRLAHQLQPAAITLDVMMPDMDGWSVLRALKVDPVLHTIPVVMLTMVDDKTRGYSLGATDYITKPVDRERLHTALEPYYTGGEHSSVLVVEDDPATRDILVRTLKDADWQVSEAGNGREALERLAEEKPQMILLDLMMPVMDGFDFLLEMRANADWQNIPVIVLTAKDLTEEDRRVLSGRVEQIVEKGASSHQQVVKLVRQVVEQAPATGKSAAPAQ